MIQTLIIFIILQSVFISYLIGIIEDKIITKKINK